MKTRSIIMVLALILVGGVAHAQDLGAGSIKLILKDSSFGGTLVPPLNAGPSEYTWTLPAQSGTLALSSVGGWSIGGNGLASTGLLGSNNGFDVTLIAGGTGAANARMTLLNAVDAVLLPTQTALRFGDASGTEYVGLVSPATNKTAGYNLVLPDTLPGGPNVRLQVANVIGSDVILTYSNPNTTGSIGFKQISNQTDNNSNAVYVPVTGLTYTVGPNAIYSFETVVVVERVGGNANAEIIWGTPTTNAPPAGLTMLYYEIQLNANNAGVQGDQNATTVNTLPGAAAPGNVYVLKGYFRTDGTTPVNSVVQMRMRSSNNGDTMRISPTSSVQLITE